MGLLFLYLGVVLTGINIAMRARSHFARLAALGVTVTFALYVLINTGMVMGLAPVVGVPLPLVSYGGTVMLTIMAGFGVALSAHMSRDPDGTTI
jgi:rod shape determining protein RodA